MPFPATPKFPGAIAQPSDLLNLSNWTAGDTQPTLLNSIAATDTSATLVSGTGTILPTDNFVITLEQEIIFVTTRTTDSLTSLTRGAAGTTAAAHIAGTPTFLFETASHHNQLAAEVNAVETQLASGVAVPIYRLIRIFSIASTQTYTPTAGTRALYVEAVGGGGGGGGAGATSASTAAGGGGGAGSKGISFLTSLNPPYTVTIGFGGPAGSGTSAGTNGGATSFGTNPTTHGGNGGSGGAAGAPATTPGGVGGTAGTADLATPGAGGGGGIALNSNVAIPGAGGSSPHGSGGVTQPTSTSSTIIGNTATGYGAGGGGGANNGTQNATSGGAGTQGLVRVWEFG